MTDHIPPPEDLVGALHDTIHYDVGRHRAAHTMPRNARVDAHLYSHLSRAELHQAAVERVAHYSRPAPAPELAGTWALLRRAWEWAAERNG